MNILSKLLPSHSSTLNQWPLWMDLAFVVAHMVDTSLQREAPDRNERCDMVANS